MDREKKERKREIERIREMIERMREIERKTEIE